MCEFCTQHGDGKVWFKNAANYSRDLMADINRRQYVNEFFTSTIEMGLITIGRLEGIYQKKETTATPHCQTDSGSSPGTTFRAGGYD